MNVPVEVAGAAALALSAVSSVVSARVYAKKKRDLNVRLLVERSLCSKQLDRITRELTKKAARLSPKQQVSEALRLISNLRMGFRL